MSAGHSSLSQGVSANDYHETDIVLPFRDELARELRRRGCYVLTDGSPMHNFQLSTAIRLANTVDGPRVEFHINSGSKEATGVEAFSLSGQRSLSRILASVTAVTLDLKLRGSAGWKSDTQGQHSRLAFCREAKGVVLEMFFLTNLLDCQHFFMHREQLIVELAETLFHVKPA